MSAECDLAAPYCEDQHCSEMCTVDTSCPVTSPSIGSSMSFAVNRAGGGVGTVDFDGQPRPIGASPDVGADEAF
jgi:hypothetical protein